MLSKNGRWGAFVFCLILLPSMIWGCLYNKAIILFANVGHEMVIANACWWIIAKDCAHIAAGKTLFALHKRTLRKKKAKNNVKLTSFSLLI